MGKWRVNEIERKKRKEGFLGLAFSGSSKSFIHSSKRDFRFIVFLFCFHLRERAGRGKERGKAKREKKERWGKGKKKGEREKERGEKGRKDFYLREREISIIKTK